MLAVSCVDARAAATPALITKTATHILASGLGLVVTERDPDPIERIFADETRTANGYSPLAPPGKPFVFCWEPEKKRLWVSSPEITGHVDLTSLPTEQMKESSTLSTLVHHASLVPAKMPAHLRTSAAAWFKVTAAPPSVR